MRPRPHLLVTAVAVATLATGCGPDSPTVSAPTSTTEAQAGSATGDPATGAAPTASTTSPDPTTVSTPTTASRLAGSRWHGSNSTGEPMTLHLRADGQFEYTTNGQQRDTTPGNDAWTQTGSTLVLKPNSGYATYTGTVSGRTYSGTATNITGKTWTFTFTRTL